MKKILPRICLVLLVLPLSRLHARINETEADVESRFGKTVSKDRFVQHSRGFDNQPEVLSESDRASQLDDLRQMFPDDFRKDGTRIDFAADDWLVYSDDRLVFFDTATGKLEDLRSSVLGKKIYDKSSAALKAVSAKARSHLKQRFYIRDDIRISVIYMDGRSVSEAYSQRHTLFSDEVINSLIKNSFPEYVPDKERDDPGLFKVLSSEHRLVGCATYIDATLKVSTTAFFSFVKDLEKELADKSTQDAQSQIKGF